MVPPLDHSQVEKLKLLIFCQKDQRVETIIFCKLDNFWAALWTKIFSLLKITILKMV